MNKVYSYPIFLSLQGKFCVVVGGGEVALRKIGDILEAGADVTVIAETPIPSIKELARTGEIILLHRRFSPYDIDGAFIVFAATDDNVLNAEISSFARKQRILVNAVDNPSKCDFFSGAIVKRGPLRIAVSTSGRCPGIAASIRRELEELYSESYAGFLETIGEMRDYVLQQDSIDEDVKKTALDWLCSRDIFTLYENSGKEIIWKKFKKKISC